MPTLPPSSRGSSRTSGSTSADPIMKLSRDALADKLEHVRVVREGARGATGFQGGGCGCN